MWGAFLTGSMKYGGAIRQPTDMDVVVPCTPQLRDMLITNSDNGKLPCRYGKLNLVLVTTPEEYAAWLLSTRRCADKFLFEDYDKAEAIRIHEECRAMFGVEVRSAASSAKGDEGEGDDDGAPEEYPASNPAPVQTVTCPECHGTGYYSGPRLGDEPCCICKGKGRVTVSGGHRSPGILPGDLP